MDNETYYHECVLLCFQMSQNCVSATENIVCVIVLLSLVPDVRRTVRETQINWRQDDV